MAGPTAAAIVTWVAFTAVNLPSRSVPIVLGAAVGGALWAGLAWWSGGMLASLASHILWTGSMLALPPAPGREVVGA
jgi:membrane protease YdiL (CAAX protease family)